MDGEDNTLAKTLTLAPAVGLAITMVVGSGLLVLPGLAYEQASSAAIYAWGLSALVSVPLLVIFARLGASFPSAGGIAGFMQATFSRRAGAATELLILGTVPGGAAIAITGGKYFSAMFNGQQSFVVAGTLLVLAIAAAVNYFGARISGRVQQILAFGLVLLLGGVAVVALAAGDTSAGTGIAPITQATTALPTVGIVFFAFVGWELMSFTTEEFKNPKRDFPLMIAISYAIVVALYLLIAITIQLVLPPDNPQLSVAPMAALLASALGSTSGRLIAVVGFFIALANVISVVWAFSRLTFSSAREGLLPAMLSQTDTKATIPRKAILVVTAAFGLVTLLYFAGLVSQSRLFELASLSFFLSYILAVLAFLRYATSIKARLFGFATFVFVTYVFLQFGVKVIYPIAVFLLGLAISYLQQHRLLKSR
jgi:amino acid efflux transporter